MSRATSARAPTLPDAAHPGRPHIRLLDAQSAESRTAAGESPPGDEQPHEQGGDQVLVAAANASARARMLAELRSLLPPDTRFVEASEAWEVIARAAGSRMVVLAGDLGEASRSSLLRLLARRNPELPVLAVGGTDRRAAGGRLCARPPALASAGEHREALDAAGA